MGHYYSEMACSTCGNIPCKCPTPVDNTPNMWMVDPLDLSVMQVSKFDKKYEYRVGKNGLVFPGSPHLMRWNAELFATEAEAMAHRFVVIEKQLMAQRQTIHEANVQLEVLYMKREKLYGQT